MIPVELPNFEASWWPVRMETIPGSGEAFTIAVLVQAESGQSQVRQAVSPSVLTSLFGAAGKGVQTMVGTTVIDIQRQLDAGVKIASLEFPFGGFHLATARDCVARDINEVFDIGVRLSAVFGVSPFGRRQEASGSTKRAFDDWFEKVRGALLLHEARLLAPEEFNVPVKLSRKGVRIGFLHAGYAANFGVLRPGQTSGDSRSLKVKVFDLEAMRRDQLYAVGRAEVLIGCPSPEGYGGFSARELDTFHASLEFLEVEASARNVALHRFSSHAAAAQHIRQALAA